MWWCSTQRVRPQEKKKKTPLTVPQMSQKCDKALGALQPPWTLVQASMCEHLSDSNTTVNYPVSGKAGSLWIAENKPLAGWQWLTSSDSAFASCRWLPAPTFLWTRRQTDVFCFIFHSCKFFSAEWQIAQLHAYRGLLCDKGKGTKLMKWLQILWTDVNQSHVFAIICHSAANSNLDKNLLYLRRYDLVWSFNGCVPSGQSSWTLEEIQVLQLLPIALNSL